MLSGNIRQLLTPFPECPRRIVVPTPCEVMRDIESGMVLMESKDYFNQYDKYSSHEFVGFTNA